jgi:hypothetical protein
MKIYTASGTVNYDVSDCFIGWLIVVASINIPLFTFFVFRVMMATWLASQNM